MHAPPGREPKQGSEPPKSQSLRERCERLAQSPRLCRELEAPRVRHHIGEQQAHQPLRERTPVGALDMDGRMVDEVHVMNAWWEGRHAGGIGQGMLEMHIYRDGREA